MLFRSMLVFCREQGWIEKLPLTKDEAVKVKDKAESEESAEAAEGK